MELPALSSLGCALLVMRLVEALRLHDVGVGALQALHLLPKPVGLGLEVMAFQPPWLRLGTSPVTTGPKNSSCWRSTVIASALRLSLGPIFSTANA